MSNSGKIYDILQLANYNIGLFENLYITNKETLGLVICLIKNSNNEHSGIKNCKCELCFIKQISNHPNYLQCENKNDLLNVYFEFPEENVEELLNISQSLDSISNEK
jgi:hypothetical protein